MIHLRRHRKATPPPAGLGDVVHVIAQPIARALDRTLGTRIEGCTSCAARRAALNQRFPFRSKPIS